MRYAGIKKFDIENGLGIGLTLFTQGCSKNCFGCHNPNTHSYDDGYEFTEQVFNDIVTFFENNPQVNRCTLSGGDPLESLELCEWVLSVLKTKFQYLKIWIYTGFTFEYLTQNEKYKSVLNMCDILVDGKFEINNRKPNLHYKGSCNQRIIDVKKSIKENKVVLFEINTSQI